MWIRELIKWWWNSNAAYLRENDPWVFPLIALFLPTSLLLRASIPFIKIIIFLIRFLHIRNKKRKIEK